MNGAVFFVMFLGAVVSGLIASGKNRSVAGWAVLGALMPLIAAVIVGAIPAEPARPPEPGA
jgi:hypothetical protein